MDREDLLETRQRVFDEYKERVRLGEFDVNAKSFVVILMAQMDIINHLLEDMKKKK